jgi:hypothetical protein
LGFGVPPPPPLDFPVGEVQVPVLVSIRRPPRRGPSGERRRAPGASLGSSIREDPTVRKNMGTAPQPEKRRASASPRSGRHPPVRAEPSPPGPCSGRHPPARAAAGIPQPAQRATDCCPGCSPTEAKPRSDLNPGLCVHKDSKPLGGDANAATQRLIRRCTGVQPPRTTSRGKHPAVIAHATNGAGHC